MFSVGLVYYGIALHTPEFGSNVYLVFFLAGLMEIPANFISKQYFLHNELKII